MLGNVEIHEKDVAAYLEEFSKAKDLAGRGAIAQLVMPYLASAFLGYKAMDRENINLNTMLVAHRKEVANLQPALDALWSVVCRDTKTGACPKIPDALRISPYSKLVDEIRSRIETLFGELGEHLESRLKLATNTLENGVLSTIHAEGCRAMIADQQISTPAMRPHTARELNQRVFLAIEAAFDVQKAECVSAIMEGRTPRLLDRHGEIHEEATE